MRPQLVVGAGAAILIGALAGIEWWAEHRWRVDDVIVLPAETVETGLPEASEVETPDASASPRLSR